MNAMTRIEFRITEKLKEKLKQASSEEGMTLSEYLLDLIRSDLTERRRMDAKRGLSFDDACEIYGEWCEANDYLYQQPGSSSEYENGIWTLSNINGILAKVGTACCCVIEPPDCP